jgi:hypothetical protein
VLETRLDALIGKYSEQGRDSSVPVPEWILPPLSCQFIEEIAKLLPPDSRAFEFGSGRSTHALRRAFLAVFSLEHSRDWLEQTEGASVAAVHDRRTNPTSAELPRRATDETVVVPLERCWNRLRLIESFNLAKHPDILARLKEARFILVDSPPNPAKREHALFLALRHAVPGAVIVLDDLEIRATTRFAHRFARQNPKQFRFWRANIDHQLGVFLKLRPGRFHSRPSLIEFVGTWLRA